MENKIYTYNNITYKLKPLTLNVLSLSVPVLVKYRKLQQKYTADINMKAVENSKLRIAELELSIDQLKENSEEPGANKGGRIEELEQKLKIANGEFENDSELQSKLKLYNECLGLAMLELIGDARLLKPFLLNVLEPVGESSSEINIDLQEPSAVEFVKDVVPDFFALIAGARKKSAG